MRPIDHLDTGDRLVRIERMIEQYDLETTRRLERRARSFWRRVELREMLVEFEKPVERVH
jgi:hypothetical protein